MSRNQFRTWLVLGMLCILGLLYGAQVYVSYTPSTENEAMVNLNEDGKESKEENVKETAIHLFMEESPSYQLNPTNASALPPAHLAKEELPEAHLRLNTPPPDLG